MDLLTALCIDVIGWSSEEEHTEWIKARKLIDLHARSHYLKVAMQNLEAEKNGTRIVLPPRSEA